MRFDIFYTMKCLRFVNNPNSGEMFTEEFDLLYRDYFKIIKKKIYSDNDLLLEISNNLTMWGFCCVVLNNKLPMEILDSRFIKYSPNKIIYEQQGEQQ